MIEKMKFLSVTGPKEDIDRVVNDYLSKYEIHLENALSELKTVKSLRPYIEINPYKDKLTKAEEFASMLGTDKNQENPTGTISIEEASETLATLESKFSDIYTRTNALEAKKEDLKASYERLRPFLGFDFDIHSVLQFKFIKYRFGKITRDYYKNWSTMSTKIWTPCSIAAAKMSSMYGVFTLCRRAEPDRSMPYFLPCTLNASTFRMNTKVFHRKSVQNFSLISMILMSSFRSAVKKVRNCSTSTKTKSCFAETNSVHSLQTLMCVNLQPAQKKVNRSSTFCVAG